MPMAPRRNIRKPSQRSASVALQTAGKLAGIGGVALVGQLVYVAVTTPRLPPPEKSGHAFDLNGILVQYDNEDIKNGSLDNSEPLTEEFNLVLVGDSPVEGIGCRYHKDSMGGQTALAFSRTLNSRPVRYWSFGKSGLTAAGIQSNMCPLMKKISASRRIDAIVISCGVNNVLSNHSAGRFRKEVETLLDSISANFDVENEIGACKPIIIVMGILDFSYMPFLPWPLSSVLGWRSRCLQREMEAVIEERQKHQALSVSSGENDCNLTIAKIPPFGDILSGLRNDLLPDIKKNDLSKLCLNDFFANDGFHPAKYGTTAVGHLLALSYMKLCQGSIMKT